MYESYFGFTGAPFLLNPDPSFYFDSRGHSSALSYLKFGLYQAEGFIVITGDIGAGKTTLVKTLLKDIDHDKVVAAQLVSTQLEAGDLLRAAMTAFGIPSRGDSKAELIAALEGYLTLLATQGKRAVLIVDEAQNLSRDAVEELRMLSNFQFGNQALLQSFLIGQPELRDMLLSRSLEQLRQRVIASYHLGPMDRDETRRYIEHRLQKVGWADQRPHITPEAFDEFYEWTGGIPRRINMLCNRVLLSTFLEEGDTVDAGTVSRIAQEIRAEIGEAPLSRKREADVEIDSQPMPLDGGHGTPVSITQGLEPLPAGATLTWPANGHTSTSEASEQPFILCVTSSRASTLRAAPLVRLAGMRQGMLPVRVLQFDTANGFHLHPEWAEHIDVGPPHFRLTLSGATSLQRFSGAIQLMDEFLRQHRPAVVLVQAGADSAAACALAAQRHGIPVIHMESGLRSFDRRCPDEVNRQMCDHIGEMLYTSEWVAHDNLSREGIPADRVQFVGNLLMDTIKDVLPQASQPKYTLRQLNLPTQPLKNKKGIAVIYTRAERLTADPTQASRLIGLLEAASADMPCYWPVDTSTLQWMQAHDLMPGGQITMLPLLPYHKMIGLLNTARCVLTDSTTVQEEATILGIPCLTLNNHTERRITVEQGSNIVVGHNASLITRALAEIHRGAGKKGRLPKFWDGQAANRMTDHLSNWLKPRVNPSQKPTNFAT